MKQTISIFALVLVVACAHAPESPNLLTNPSFSRGVKGWSVTTFPPGKAWIASGAEGHVGLIQVTEEMHGLHPLGQTADSTAAWQCVAVDPAMSYDATVEVFIPDDQRQEGAARIDITWWKTARCSDVEFRQLSPDIMFSFSSKSRQVSVVGAWHLLRACDIRPPEGAVAAEFALEATNFTMTPNGTFRAIFDNASLIPHDESCQPTPAN